MKLGPLMMLLGHVHLYFAAVTILPVQKPAQCMNDDPLKMESTQRDQACMRDEYSHAIKSEWQVGNYTPGRTTVECLFLLSTLMCMDY